MTIEIRVIPRAGRTMIAGIRHGALLVRLAAAPVDGAANDALVALLAETFSLPKRAIAIVAGAQSRNKRIRLEGLTDADVQRRLAELAA